MKVTLNWLKDYVDFDIPADELAHRLTMAGLEVEAYYTVDYDFSGVFVGNIVEHQSIPGSDKLSLCKVNVNNELVQVVCGAPNARKGLKSAIALPGSKVGPLDIKTADIRGQHSEGMLCSEAELGLSNRAAGIMELPPDAKIGQPIESLFAESDVVFDIAITPNRPDCLSVIGIAREIAALGGARLHKPKIELSLNAEPVSDYIDVNILNADKCFRYSGRFLKDIKIQNSPYWMARRLYLVDVRAINNVVDITNYILMETGHPLHAFDYERLEGKKIIVRTAKEKEKFTTLDEKEHILTPEDLLICDAEKPVALAGVMGGFNSEVIDSTSSVFLESAYFEPVSISRTAKNLELSTESSRRFERGADPNGTLYAMDRAAMLMQQYADATVLENTIDVYPRNVEPMNLSLTVRNTNRILGTDLHREDLETILSSIEFTITAKNDGVSVSVPTFRPDVQREIDLIEEIARLYNYDRIPTNTNPQVDLTQKSNKSSELKDYIRSVLTGLGFWETINLSLVNPQIAKPFLPEKQQFVELLNPLNTELSVFRPNMLYSLMTSVSYSRNRQFQNLRFFQVGNVAWMSPENQITEMTQIAAVITGQRKTQTWYQKPEAFDFYDIKGALFSLFDKLGVTAVKLTEAKDSFWDSTSAALSLNGRQIGAVGKLDSQVCDLFSARQDVYGFYLQFEPLFKAREKEIVFTQIPKYPSVPFDLALLVDASVPIADLEEGIWEKGGEHLIKVDLFDFYRGQQIEKNMKSVAFSLTFSSKERTLQDEYVNQVIDSILSHLRDKFGATLRPR
ncbi:phenylalanine--tRNA ligase subunit beta [candidate division KSB1 bacterium]|nr:phenylalanine--tRNA ligase subunit beta [candidate division KSB1 bacterium]